MAATDTDSVHDHMTRLRMKMVQQKIANERDKLRPASEGSTDEDDQANQIKLQQAMLRRQELLDRIKHEQYMNEDYRRPRSYSARRRYTPSPNPPPSRRSLPNYTQNFYNNKPENTYRDNTFRDRDRGPPGYDPRTQDMAQVKHVIEHRVATPKQYHLPPIQGAPQPSQQPPTITMATPPQHIIQQIPQPVFQNLVPDQQNQNKHGWFNKADFMEMMMMQNAQMHHMVMQQMMLHSLPGLNQGGGGGGARTYPVSVVAEPAAPMVVSRPGAGVHHHHYQMSPPMASAPPMINHYASLPPMDMRMSSPMRVKAPVTSREPGRPALPERSRSYSPPPVAGRKGVRKFMKAKHPFPGPRALRKFRHVCYAAWFIAKLRASVNKTVGNRPSSVFLFGIILKEIVAALHRIYLNPSGNIYPVLADVISPNAYDLSALLRGRASDREAQVMLQELQYFVENLVYHITEIMPSTGVLGTHRKSAVYELIKNGKRFPDGYFWQIELDQLQFTDNGRTAAIGDPEAFLLIIGIFISRSLVTTLLMKPVDYGLSNQQLSDVGERNLKILATTLLYLVRRVSVFQSRSIMPMPGEIAKYLYTDEEMRPIYVRLGRSFNYAEGLLREWGQEYIKRLRVAPMPK